MIDDDGLLIAHNKTLYNRYGSDLDRLQMNCDWGTDLNMIETKMWTFRESIRTYRDNDGVIRHEIERAIESKVEKE